MNPLSKTKSFAAVVVTIVSSVMFSQSADASTYRHIDSLAVRLQGQAREMIGELRLHYRHTGDFQHLLSDAYEVFRLAAHVHEVIHHDDCLPHVRADIDALDRKFHHLENLVAHITHHPHGGHVDGNTFHIHQMLAAMEDTLHHLQEDIDELTGPHHGHGFGATPQYVVPAPAYHGHGAHYVPSNGVRVRNDRFSIRFSW